MLDKYGLRQVIRQLAQQWKLGLIEIHQTHHVKKQPQPACHIAKKQPEESRACEPSQKSGGCFVLTQCDSVESRDAWQTQCRVQPIEIQSKGKLKK